METEQTNIAARRHTPQSKGSAVGVSGVEKNFPDDTGRQVRNHLCCCESVVSALSHVIGEATGPTDTASARARRSANVKVLELGGLANEIAVRDDIRAVVLDEIYKSLPSGMIQLSGGEQYVGLGGMLSSTGAFKAHIWPRQEILHVNHINEMPVETLIELRRMLRERFPEKKPLERPEPSVSCHVPVKRTKHR